jgi:hypothetical protein
VPRTENHTRTTGTHRQTLLDCTAGDQLDHSAPPLVRVSSRTATLSPLSSQAESPEEAPRERRLVRALLRGSLVGLAPTRRRGVVWCLPRSRTRGLAQCRPRAVPRRARRGAPFHSVVVMGFGDNLR